MKFNFVSILTVRGRKSGKWISTPITPIDFNGHVFLVAPRGETQWVRNLRQENKARLTTKGKIQQIATKEISGKLQIAVVTKYQERVKISKSQFSLLPNPSDHPTFKVEFYH